MSLLDTKLVHGKTTVAVRSDISLAAPATSHFIVVVQSPSLHWGGSKWLVDSPRVLSSDNPLTNIFLLVFYPCCPLRGHRWTALLILNDHPLFHLPSEQLFLFPFPTQDFFIYLTYCCFSYSCFFSPAVTFTPTLALQTPALSAPLESPGEIDRYNAPPTVLSGCTSLALASNQLIFKKFLQDTLGPVKCAHLPLPPLLKLSPYLIFKYSQNSKILIFKNEPPKTINNSPDLLNHPQLNYPSSVSSLPPPQPQPSTCPLTQSCFHHSSPSQNSLRILQWNANGIRPCRTEFIQFLSLNQYNLIFVQQSLSPSDSTFNIPGYKTLKKDRSITRRGTTDSYGKPRRWCSYTCQKRFNLLPLSTQHLSLLDRSSDYSAITVKIKRTSSLYLFNLYVPPIHSSSSCDSRPKSFSTFLLPSSHTSYTFDDFNCHHSSCDSHIREDQLDIGLFDCLLSSDLLNNPDYPTLLHRRTGNCSSDLSL